MSELAIPPAVLLAPCDVCGKSIPPNAKKCTECNSPQNGRDCIVCGGRIPRCAQKCDHCESFQDWRRRIPVNQTVLALLTAMLSVAGALGAQVIRFVDLHSQTSGFFLDIDKLGPDRRCITVRLLNNGGRPAQADKASIKFTSDSKDRRVEAADLTIVNRSNKVIPARNTSDLTLYVRNLQFIGAPKLPPFADVAALDAANNSFKADVAQALCSTKTVVTVQVNEHDWFNRVRPKPVDVEIDKDAAQAWVLERMVGKNPAKVGCE